MLKTKVLSASTLSGYRVRNSSHEDLGTIEEFMIDPGTGRIAYAVLSFGGFMGIGDKLFAIPWTALRLRAEERAFVIDMDRNRLQQAPAFQQDEWPDFADEHWGKQIQSFYDGQLRYSY